MVCKPPTWVLRVGFLLQWNNRDKTMEPAEREASQAAEVIAEHEVCFVCNPAPFPHFITRPLDRDFDGAMIRGMGED